ncbi:hypothetical protein PVAG01_09087 [Phlyctema vagabunda]|uniref:C2H2-type domain-containing protein n=1 Tax=Phlyctema vagabunda TaxID=108571 RepID=A0ABR4P6Y7_9HELO
MLPQQGHQFLRPPARTPLRPRQNARPQPAQASSTSSSSPKAEPPRPSYPIPIPPQKLNQAVELYRKFLLAELLNESPPRSQSKKGRSTASQAETAVSVSTNGELVDFGIMSLGDNSGSLTAYDGKTVKVNKRSALSPKARAKAELIRFLGACVVCRTRRVQCPFDHHDIAHLDEVYQRQSSGSPSRSQHQGSQSSNTSCDSSGTVAPESQTMMRNSQTDTLFGIGESLHYTITDTSMSELDAQPSIAEPSQRPSVRTAEIERPGPLFDEYLTRVENSDFKPYGALMNGENIFIGVFCHVVEENGKRIGFFQCQHPGCSSRFDATDKLQEHFAQEHFAYSRLDPNRVYTCVHCNARLLPQAKPSEAICTFCGLTGSKLWIVGSFLGGLYQQQDPPDWQPVGQMAPSGSDTRSYASSDSGGGAFLQPGGPMLNENQIHGNVTTHHGFDYAYPTNTYPEPSTGDYQYGNHQYGSQFTGTQFAQASPMGSVHVSISTSDQGRSSEISILKKRIAFLLALLLIVFLGHSSFDWFILRGLTKMPRPISQPSQEDFPILGFMSLLFSSAAFWTIKHVATRARRRRIRHSVCSLEIRPSCDPSIQTQRSMCPRYAIPLFTPAKRVPCSTTTTFAYSHGTV